MSDKSRNPLAQTLLNLSPVRENIVVIHGDFVEFTGSLEAAALLNQCLYWTPKAPYKNGWFWKSDEEWSEQLFISKYRVRKAVAALQDMDVLEYAVWKENDVPVTHYRLKMNELIEKWSDFIAIKTKEADDREDGLPEFNPTLRNRKIGNVESEKSDFANPKSPNVESEKTLYTKTTTETTIIDQEQWLSDEEGSTDETDQHGRLGQDLHIRRLTGSAVDRTCDYHEVLSGSLDGSAHESESQSTDRVHRGTTATRKKETTGQNSEEISGTATTKRTRKKSKTGESPSEKVLKAFVETATAFGRTPKIGYRWTERSQILADILQTNTTEDEIRFVVAQICKKYPRMPNLQLSKLAENIYECRPHHSKDRPMDVRIDTDRLPYGTKKDDARGDIESFDDIDEDMLRGLSL